jgi:hypothetical protein
MRGGHHDRGNLRDALSITSQVIASLDLAGNG